MSGAKLSQRDLEFISDDLLDEMIKGLEEETGFKTFLYGLQGPLGEMGFDHLFIGIEERITAFHTQLAEAAFAAGHEYGYGAAALNTIDILKQALAA